MNQFDLQNRTAVITGGGRGIGRALAERLLVSGARISLWNVDAAALAQASAEMGTPDTMHTATADRYASRLGGCARSVLTPHRIRRYQSRSSNPFAHFTQERPTFPALLPERHPFAFGNRWLRSPGPAPPSANFS